MAKRHYGYGNKKLGGKIFMDKLQKAVEEELLAYGEFVSGTAMREAVQKTSDYAVQELRSRSHRRTGDYADGWTNSEWSRPKAWMYADIVYNAPKYQLTHLLEKGHRNRNKSLPDIPPYPAGGHIAPVEAELQDKLIEFLKEEVSKW